MFDLKRVTRIQGIGRTGAKAIPGVKDALGDTALGEFLGISTKDVWRLKMKDPPNTDFRGQFVAEGLIENIGARLSDDGALNKQSTDTKYLGGQGETINFKTRIWANSSVKNVKKSVELLKSFTKRDPDLKRAPIFTFTSGTEIQCLCFVQTVGGIAYDKPRSDGTIRGATFSVVLTKIEELPTKEQGLSIASLVKTGLGIISAAAGFGSILGKINIPGGSLHIKGKKVITKQSQTFEHLAQQEYGQALIGDVLRRAHYQKPLSQIKMSLEIGDVVDLVEESDILTIPITPQSIALLDGTVNRQNIQDQLDLRGGSKVIYV